MMNIGLVRVLVGEFGMSVHVGVLPGRRERRVAGLVVMVVMEVVVAVAVLVDGCRVPVGMGVLLGDHQPGSEGHDGQRNVEGACRKFGEEQEREEDAEERGDGKERTCPGCADAPEGEEEEDARQPPVAEEPDRHGGGGNGRVREVFPGGECDKKRDGAGPDPFDGDDEERVLCREPLPQVVVDRPEEAGEQDAERRKGESESGGRVPGEEEARCGDAPERNPDAAAHPLTEYRRGNQGRRNGLEVQEEGRRRRRCSREAVYQGDRCKKPAKERHADEPEYIPPPGRRLDMAPPGSRGRSGEGEEESAGAAPERDECGENERPDIGKEQLRERGAPADQDRRRQRAEDGCPVVRQSGSVLYDGFTRVQESCLRVN